MRLLLPAIYLIASCVVSGCATSAKDLPLYEGLGLHEGSTLDSDDSKIDVQYLGVGGYLIRYGDTAIMTAPSFTNPSLFKLASLTHLTTDKELVDRLMPPAGDVDMMLVGHAHYDHLLDVPYVMNRHTPKAHVYGSKTMTHLMAPAIEKARVHNVLDRAATDSQPGEWVYNARKTVRILPIRSQHAPHFMGVTLGKGHYDEDLESLPRTILGWLEGETLAYLIDFLDDRGNAIFRIHFQDAASQPPKGFMPPAINNDGTGRVDLVIFCVASYDEVEGYPEGIIEYSQPRAAILGHWEDFFGNQGEALEVVRLTNPFGFIERMQSVLPDDTTWYMPKPMALMRFPVRLEHSPKK